MKLEMEELLSATVKLAKRAGAEILKIYRNPNSFNVSIKKDNSPVTQADLVANQIIVTGLTQLTPEIPIISEESANITYSQRENWDLFWLVDPLDGTKEFIHNTDEFTVNIALIKNNSPILGVIYIPIYDETYFALANVGAWDQKKNESAKQIFTRKPLANKLVIAISRRHGLSKLQDFLDQLGEHEIVHYGSSIKSCLVAAGEVDIYPSFGHTSEWDTAAAQCIVEAAGGAIIDWQGKPLRYNTKKDLLNPPFLAVGDKNYPWHTYFTALYESKKS